MISKLFMLLALCAFLSSAQSNELDFKKLSCGQYLLMIENLIKEKRMASASGVLMWLYGYHSARADSTLYSQEDFRQFAKTLKKECIADTNKPLMAVIEQ